MAAPRAARHRAWTRGWRSSGTRGVGALVLRAAAMVLAIAAAILVAVHAWFAVKIVWWATHPPVQTSFMAYRQDELRQANPAAKLAYQWVPYERISVHAKRAVIAAEDAKFVDHEGFDWAGIQKAMERNEKRGRIVAGGSTITQQLAKNLFLTPSRSWLRKAEEAVITVMLEALLDKERILEIYLNVIELGNGVFGVEAASRRYFGVSAAQLTKEQAARLAAMAPNPRYYERHPGAPGLARKIAIIAARMGQAEIP